LFEKRGNGYQLVYQNPDKQGATRKEFRREKRLFVGRALQSFTYSVNVINHFSALFRHQMIRAATVSDARKIYSGFTDYTPDQMKRMAHVVCQIIASVGDRPLIWMVIRRTNDLAPSPKKTTPFVKNLKEMTKSFKKVSLLDHHQKFQCSGDWEKITGPVIITGR